jgi:predicted aldo/keto reductase-like oxidoreductase
MKIPNRQLGKVGPSVGCLGYGAMVLEGYYGSSNDEEAITTIRRALESGMTMIDSADACGNGHNETLVGRAIRGRREQPLSALNPVSSSIRLKLGQLFRLDGGFLSESVGGRIMRRRRWKRV